MVASRKCCMWAAVAAVVLAAERDAAVLDAPLQDLIEFDDACVAGADAPSCDLTLLQMRAGRGGATEASEADKAASAVSGDAAAAAAKKQKSSSMLEHSLWQKPAGGKAPKQYINYDEVRTMKPLVHVENIKTLYHQTSKEAGESILKTGFRPGTWHAICGSAIYFSPTANDTDHKAMGGRGFMIEATVDVGQTLHSPRDCDPKMTAEKLEELGYDSITLDRGGYMECYDMDHCIEWIIYDPKKVLSMKGYEYKGWAHWWGDGPAPPPAR